MFVGRSTCDPDQARAKGGTGPATAPPTSTIPQGAPSLRHPSTAAGRAGFDLGADTFVLQTLRDIFRQDEVASVGFPAQRIRTRRLDSTSIARVSLQQGCTQEGKYDP